jgi:Leucine-rich repeat (LRR) protein
LSNNKLTTLPSLDFYNIKTLNLSNNQFTAIPEAIESFKTLSILILENNQITSLPDFLFDLTDLAVLDLSGTPIKDTFDKTLFPARLSIIFS